MASAERKKTTVKHVFFSFFFVCLRLLFRYSIRIITDDFGSFDFDQLLNLSKSFNGKNSPLEIQDAGIDQDYLWEEVDQQQAAPAS